MVKPSRTKTPTGASTRAVTLFCLDCPHGDDVVHKEMFVDLDDLLEAADNHDATVHAVRAEPEVDPSEFPPLPNDKDMTEYRVRAVYGAASDRTIQLVEMQPSGSTWYKRARSWNMSDQHYVVLLRNNASTEAFWFPEEEVLLEAVE